MIVSDEYFKNKKFRILVTNINIYVGVGHHNLPELPFATTRRKGLPIASHNKNKRPRKIMAYC